MESRSAMQHDFSLISYFFEKMIRVYDHILISNISVTFVSCDTTRKKANRMLFTDLIYINKLIFRNAILELEYVVIM